MSNPKVYCYDKVCNCWVEDFEIHTNNCVSINQVWSTNDVDLYVKKADYDQLKKEIEMLKANNKQLVQSDIENKNCDNCYYGDIDKQCPEDDDTICGETGILHKWKPLNYNPINDSLFEAWKGVMTNE